MVQNLNLNKVAVTGSNQVERKFKPREYDAIAFIRLLNQERERAQESPIDIEATKLDEYRSTGLFTVVNFVVNENMIIPGLFGALYRFIQSPFTNSHMIESIIKALDPRPDEKLDPDRYSNQLNERTLTVFLRAFQRRFKEQVINSSPRPVES